MHKLMYLYVCGGVYNGMIMAGENRRLGFFCDREERVLWEKRTNFCDMEGYKVMLRKVCFREKKRDYDPSSCVRIHVSLDCGFALDQRKQNGRRSTLFGLLY